MTDTIVENIKRICKARGITLKEMSKQSGVSYSNVLTSIPYGHNCDDLTIGTLRKIAETLECTIGDLTDGVVDTSKFS